MNNLSRDLGIAITHIAKHNSFDKQDLIKLLKRTRDHIDNYQPLNQNEIQGARHESTGNL